MLITKMPREECIALLSRARIAHLACACDGKLYVVPLFLAYDDSHLYCFSTIGRKIDPIYFRISIDEISGRRTVPP